MEQNEFLEKVAIELSKIKTADQAYTCNRYIPAASIPSGQF